MAVLEIENLHTYYGRIRALNGISVSVGRGEIVALIGANGAGKTTALKTISGLIRPQQGSIRLEGAEITRANEILTGKRGGKPCIRGMRITVYDVLEYLASGMTEQEILFLFSEKTHQIINF